MVEKKTELYKHQEIGGEGKTGMDEEEIQSFAVQIQDQGGQRLAGLRYLLPLKTRALYQGKPGKGRREKREKEIFSVTQCCVYQCLRKNYDVAEVILARHNHPLTGLCSISCM